MTTWTSREQLGATEVGTPARLSGLVLAASSGSSAVSLSAAELATAAEISGRTLRAAGIDKEARVVTALTMEADGAIVLNAALESCASAVVANGPRGRMRLHRLINSFRPSVLVITPTGAMDLLARMHLESFVDPEELGLDQILLVGEVPTPGTLRQLAAEFACRVTEIWCDPTFGVALAHRSSDASELHVTDPNLLFAASLRQDEIVSENCEHAELVVRPAWSCYDLMIRTGWLSSISDSGLASPTNTVGDLVLVRGRWVSTSAINSLFSRIDGIDHWSLEIRRDGTLDAATVHVAFGRESLVGNPMWAGRVEEALRQATPISLASSTMGTPDWSGAPIVDDQRGHHLGCDRSTVAI